MDKDLPMCANVSEVKVRHYMFEFFPNFKMKYIRGRTLLFMDPHSSKKCDLDCHNLKIKKVTVLRCKQEEVDQIFKWFKTKNPIISNASVSFQTWLQKAEDEIQYDVSQWKLSMDLPEGCRVVSVRYETASSTRSLLWRHDQDGNACVFTPGSVINNRGIFPAQDYPSSLSTWQASVRTPDDYTVLMTGDEKAKVQSSEYEDEQTSYYYTTMLNPVSAFAMAIGKWACRATRDLIDLDTCKNRSEQPIAEFAGDPLGTRIMQMCGIDKVSDLCKHEPYPCHLLDDTLLLAPVARVFLCTSMSDACVSVLMEYVSKAFVALSSFLGAFPFPRLDVLIVPRCYASLGFTSPNLLILSQSVLAEDGSMMPQVAHELSHVWWGLLVGLQDWREDWLNEGFATYSQDVIDASITKRDEQEEMWTKELINELRRQRLLADMQNVDPSLQTLKPQDEEEDRIVNGTNPERRFSQIHYLKGHFLLQFLEELVGLQAFMTYLRCFVLLKHGQLVKSEDFLELFFNVFKEECQAKNLTMEHIIRDWLLSPACPSRLKKPTISPNNKLYEEVMEAKNEWLDRYNDITSKQAKKLKASIDAVYDAQQKQHMKAIQVVLMLEKLQEALFPENPEEEPSDEDSDSDDDGPRAPKRPKLQANKATKCTFMKCLRTYLSAWKDNADVQHRWCELVILMQFEDGYEDLSDFLVSHQAMGVYLYGEMIISRSPQLMKTAKDLFRHLQKEMDPDSYEIVEKMVGEIR